MAEIILPYNLQDGQKAYAARLMANLNAIAGKMNQVSVPGLPDGDVETALQQLKLMLDREYQADAKVVQDLYYDSTANRLCLKLADGAAFEISMDPFLSNYLGLAGETVTVIINSDHQVTAHVNDGSISYDKLSAALQQLVDNKVTAGVLGNANQILFADGVSMQHKLDSGVLKGKDGVSMVLEGIYSFRVDAADGHLYVMVADDAKMPPLTINGQGHLIYTID